MLGCPEHGRSILALDMELRIVPLDLGGQVYTDRLGLWWYYACQAKAIHNSAVMQSERDPEAARLTRWFASAFSCRFVEGTRGMLWWGRRLPCAIEEQKEEAIASNAA